jgi:hypothetical protein
VVDHPEGTGKEVPPFSSLWFCGIGADRVEQAKALYRSERTTQKEDNTENANLQPQASLATSIQELMAMGAIRDEKPRPNPRQRRKRLKMTAIDNNVGALSTGITKNAQYPDSNTSRLEMNKYGKDTIKQEFTAEKRRSKSRPDAKRNSHTNHGGTDNSNSTKCGENTQSSASKYRNNEGNRKKKRF